MTNEQSNGAYDQSVSRMPEEWHQLLHRLWSKATCNPDYVKSEWMDLEGILVQCAKKVQENDDRPHEVRP